MLNILCLFLLLNNFISNAIGNEQKIIIGKNRGKQHVQGLGNINKDVMNIIFGKLDLANQFNFSTSCKYIYEKMSPKLLQIADEFFKAYYTEERAPIISEQIKLQIFSQYLSHYKKFVNDHSELLKDKYGILVENLDFNNPDPLIMAKIMGQIRVMVLMDLISQKTLIHGINDLKALTFAILMPPSAFITYPIINKKNRDKEKEIAGEIAFQDISTLNFQGSETEKLQYFINLYKKFGRLISGNRIRYKNISYFREQFPEFSQLFNNNNMDRKIFIEIFKNTHNYDDAERDYFIDDQIAKFRLLFGVDIFKKTNENNMTIFEEQLKLKKIDVARKMERKGLSFGDSDRIKSIIRKNIAEAPNPLIRNRWRDLLREFF